MGEEYDRSGASSAGVSPEFSVGGFSVALNVVRSGTAGVLGIASGALASQPALTITTGVSLSPSSIAEGVGFVLGAGLQFLSPMTMPNLADGLVDGGLALLLRRGAAYFMAKATGGTYPGPGGYTATPSAAYRLNGATYGNVHAASASGYVRGQSATTGGLRQIRVQ
jgi:hypothetical protein